jgi:Cytidylyltransferase
MLAIIPARGGRKRIPRKNIRLFCGQPIIKYSIAAALNRLSADVLKKITFFLLSFLIFAQKFEIIIPTESSRNRG